MTGFVPGIISLTAVTLRALSTGDTPLAET